MKGLGWWLIAVGTLRLASVWFGFFDIWALRLAVFSNTTMTEVHGRTFGTWTLLTCTLCYICAFNLENKPLYLATFLSFVNIDSMDAIAMECTLESPLEEALLACKKMGQKCNTVIGGIGQLGTRDAALDISSFYLILKTFHADTNMFG